MNIGLYCPAETGHLNTMMPIGEALLKRSHQVTFVGVEDAKTKVEAVGIDFFPVAAKEFPEGSIEEIFKTLGELEGFSALLYTINVFRDVSKMILEDGAIACKSLNLDGMVIDQSTVEGVAIARYLDIPYVTVCSALPFNQESTIPPIFTTWEYHNTGWAKFRNQLANQIGSLIGKAVQQPAKTFYQKHHLPIPKTFDSPLAILCQEPAEFEFPRSKLVEHFYFTGPYHSITSRKKIDFPWDKLSDKPLIYASMGTLQNRLENVFQMIAKACENLDAQLVISLGGSADPKDLPPLAGNPLVVRYAPQIELLHKAALTITHAGMNTTLESLTYGVPLVAIPVTNDQPGIAARIKWTGAGEFIPVNQLEMQKLKQTIETVLTIESYRNNAKRLQEKINTSGGVQKAVAIIEQALETKKPVLLK